MLSPKKFRLFPCGRNFFSTAVFQSSRDFFFRKFDFEEKLLVWDKLFGGNFFLSEILRVATGCILSFKKGRHKKSLSLFSAMVSKQEQSTDRCWHCDNISETTQPSLGIVIRQGLDLNDGSTSRPRQKFKDGHFCSEACLTAYALHRLGNFWYYIVGSGTPSTVENKGSRYASYLYNLCGKHRGQGTTPRGPVQCMYADLTQHHTALGCYVSVDAWETFKCWNDACHQLVELDNAFHIPTCVVFARPPPPPTPTPNPLTGLAFF